MDSSFGIVNISKEEKETFNKFSKVDFTDRINFLKKYNIKLVEDYDESLCWSFIYKDAPNWVGNVGSSIEDIIEEVNYIYMTRGR